MKLKRKQKKRSAAIIEALEPRVLFSADVFGGVIDNPVLDDPLTTLLDDAVAAFENQTTHTQNEQTDSSDPQQLSENEGEDANALLTAEPTRKELVLIDSATPDYQQLLEDLLSQANDSRQIEVVMLDASRDGISQISEILADRSKLDAVHLISHASDGAVSLASSSLDFKTLLNNSTEIKEWGNALGETGNLLIYGCNLASTVEGELLVDTLAKLIGADVAASDDLTGHTSLGGDWELEYQTGRIDTSVAVSTELRGDWAATLDVATFQEGASG